MTNTTTTTNPTITFAGDSDTGMAWTSGDLILIAGGVENKKKDYKKVHVARRRLAKKLSRPEIWKVNEFSPTALTVT